MKLTVALKARIDGMSYEALLRGWRFSPVGSSMFEGESGAYWLKRMQELRSREGGDSLHVAASKRLGW